MFWRCVSVGVACFGTVRACRGVVLVRVGFLFVVDTEKRNERRVGCLVCLLECSYGVWLGGMDYYCVCRQVWADLGR